MSRVIRRQAARTDLVEIVHYYIGKGSPATARRFRVQAEATVQRLASIPGLGACYDHENPALAGLRYFPVSRFKKLLVFYRPAEDAIEIVRVLHGARELSRILEEELGVENDSSDDAESES